MAVEPSAARAAAAFIRAALPDFAWLLKCAEKEDGWIRLPPIFIKVVDGLKIDSYPLLYEDERRLLAFNLIALFGEEGYKEAAQKLGGMSTEAALSTATEIAIEFEDTLDTVTVPKTQAELDRAREAFKLLPPDEQERLSKRAQFFYSGFLAGFYQHIALMVHGEKLTALVQRAARGDDEALCRATQIDRNILTVIPAIKSRYARAQQEGDSKFLDALSYRMRNPIVRGRIRYRLLWLSLSILDGLELLDRLSYGELLELLDAAGLDRWENRIEDVSYLAKRVREYRAFHGRGEGSTQ